MYVASFCDRGEAGRLKSLAAARLRKWPALAVRRKSRAERESVIAPALPFAESGIAAQLAGIVACHGRTACETS